MMDKLFHKRENIGIISRSSKHKSAISEGIFHSLRHIAAGKVVDDHLRAASGAQLLRKQINRLFRVSVDGCIGDNDALALHRIGRPGIVQVDIIAEIFGQHRPVQRADYADIKPRSLFQKSLHLRTVFADDADVVPSCLACPFFLRVERAELAEPIRGKQDFVRAVISHDNLRPVHHRRRDKGECMPAEREGVALADNNAAVGKIRAEEIFHHCECLGGGNDKSLWVGFHKVGDICRVIRLHMLYNQIIRLSPAQLCLKIVHPFMCKIAVNRVHNGNLLVKNQIRIIRHAVRDDVLSLKQINIMVVDADIAYVLCDFHKKYSFPYGIK